ncbi:MAG: acyltransferase [Lentisphaerae bacterium]|nr:acyltransferase [Lentisphaerota bacterium]MCP4101656.1 acyltransferase [Lentisphaerota bacterium]
MKAATVQFNHYPGNIQHNMELISSFCEKAADAGNELVVFPEMCVTGYWHVRNLDQQAVEQMAEKVPEGKITQQLLELAVKHNISIGAGLIELGNDAKLYNTYVVAMPNGKVASHRKIHCFISQHIASGSEYTVFELPNGIKTGILICYDNNIIENVSMTALLGADILLAPHQTGGCATPSPLCMGAIDVELWEQRKTRSEELEEEFKGPKGRGWLTKWLPARAHDNGIFVIFSNGVGRDDDEVRTGNAMIIDPYGNILSETWEATDKMVSAQLDMSLLDKCTGKRWITSRRPELYKPLTIPTGKEIDTRVVRFK